MANKKQTQRGRSSSRTQSRTQSRTAKRSKSGTGTGTRKSASQRAGSARERHESERHESERGDSERGESERGDSGMPGGGQGRRDVVGGSKVYPASAGQAPADAELRNMASWGQGERGAAGYFDSGGSELVPRDGQLLGGLDVGPSGAPVTEHSSGDEQSNAAQAPNEERSR